MKHEDGTMRVTWNELVVDRATIADADGLLDSWRWLVDASCQVVMISALGDLFVQNAIGQVFWLDTGWGELTQVAESAEAFKQLLLQPENVDQWFVPQLVGDLLTSGKQLKPGECFGYRVPPVLSGAIAPENFEPTDVSVYFHLLGQIHERVQALPDGTPIGKVTIKHIDE
jgi:Domain of unknown function (DUF1851)